MIHENMCVVARQPIRNIDLVHAVDDGTAQPSACVREHLETEDVSALGDAVGSTAHSSGNMGSVAVAIGICCDGAVCVPNALQDGAVCYCMTSQG